MIRDSFISLSAFVVGFSFLPAVAFGQAGGTQTPAAEPLTLTPPAEGSKPPSFADDAWTVRIVPRAWYVAPAGDLTLPTTGGGQEVSLAALDADHPRGAPFGEVTIKADVWTFTFSGLNVQSDRTSVATSTFQIGDVSVTPGNTVNTVFDFSTFNLNVGYQVLHHVFDEAGENAFRMHVLGGARLFDLSTSVSRPGVSTSAYDFFDVELMAGVHADLQITRRIGLEVELTSGMGVNSATFDIAFAASYRPVDWLALQAGYRLLMLGAEENEGLGRAEFSGSLAGVFIGVLVRF